MPAIASAAAARPQELAPADGDATDDDDKADDQHRQEARFGTRDPRDEERQQQPLAAGGSRVGMQEVLRTTMTRRTGPARTGWWG